MELFPGININDQISFQLKNNLTNVIPVDFTDVTLVGLLSADNARLFADPYITHRNIYPLLDPGTVPDNADAYPFVVVKFKNGTFYTIGEPWIAPGTLVKIASTTIQATIENISVSDLPRLRDLLTSAGWRLSKSDVLK